jgi:hypothetical protein
VTNEPQMRASDYDREVVAGRLRDAHVEGRLPTDEFQNRLDAAYAAATYGDLEALTRDLPAFRRPRATEEAPTSVSPPRAPAPVAARRGDRVMRVLWTMWACAVSINLVIWTIVSVSNAEFTYFWPVWVAGPWGAALLSIEAVRRAAR